jgi:hypothetical protein
MELSHASQEIMRVFLPQMTLAALQCNAALLITQLLWPGMRSETLLCSLLH